MTLKLTQIPTLTYGSFMLATNALSNPDTILQHVLNTEHDYNSTVKIWGKDYKIPRRQYAVGDPGTSYTFSGSTVAARDWTPVLTDVRKELLQKIGYDYNFVLVNTYDNGEKYIGYHRDDVRDLDPKFPIASISLGATRDFLVKLDIPEQKSEKTIKIQLEHNSLLMGENSQKNYKHSLPVRKREKTHVLT